MRNKIWIIAGITVLVDFLIKRIIISYISFKQIKNIITNFFYLTYVKNTGGAWSILSNNMYMLVMIGITVLISFIYYLLKKEKYTNLETITYGLIIGGLIGNLIDRLFYSGVIDYLGFIFGNYYFPIFNLADVCIVCGILLLIYIELRSDKNGANSKQR